MLRKKQATKRKVRKATSKKKPGRMGVARSATESAGNGESRFPVVGIGASAGGLEAIEGFFSHSPANRNVAFVIIQHLASGHKSIMDLLLKRYTEMNVVQIEDGMKVEPNCVYLNPPDKNVAIINRRLSLTDPAETRGARLSIDYFFRSLADDQGEKAICIVLSGTGTDGTLGLKAIKGAGGMAMVQDEDQARYNSMPRNAIDTGLVDYVLPVEKMFGELMKYVQHPYIGGHVQVPVAKEKSEDYMRKIFLLIRSKTGHDFSHYKQNTIQRRIERRLAVHQIDDLGKYARYLLENEPEVNVLFKDILITVTNFFRDPAAFKILAKKVLPAVLKGKGPESTVRVWVPGCATGEEAYSIAILIVENIENLKMRPNIQVFATDIDRDAIEYARQGLYPESIAADVSPERLKRFFIKEEGTYRVKKQIREMVVFATQNLIKDAPFSKLDLVCCRNVLIYMDTVLQKKILPLFHYTLKPGGFMLLGTSETIGEFGDRFAVVDAKWRIFKRKGPKRIAGEYPVPPLHDSSGEAVEAGAKRPLSTANIQQLAEKTIIQDYAPPCVLVNEKYEILYFHGQTERFLSPPIGEASFNILNMVREELRYKLGAILHRAARERKTVASRGLQFKRDGGFTTVDIVVRPVVKDSAIGELMMVMFEHKDTEAKAGTKRKVAVAEQITDARIKALGQELQSTKEYLQTTIEQLETSNEELKSTNEELQSTNEELQSTNEELETSREELQSTNEELDTVNSELQEKVNQLSRANNDLSNLLGSTQIGTIFLDTDLNVKQYTSSASKIFSLIQTDVGRPLRDITSKIDYPNLLKDAEETLRTLIPKEVDLQAKDGIWYSMRILPYRTTENSIDGVVMTFVDISRQVELETRLRCLASVVIDSNDAVMALSPDGRITAWNKGAERMYGYTEAEALAMNICKIVPEHKRQEALSVIKEIEMGHTVASLETQRLTKDGRILTVWLTISKLTDHNGDIVGVGTTERDITEHKNWK